MSNEQIDGGESENDTTVDDRCTGGADVALLDDMMAEDDRRILERLGARSEDDKCVSVRGSDGGEVVLVGSGGVDCPS